MSVVMCARRHVLRDALWTVLPLRLPAITTALATVHPSSSLTSWAPLATQTAWATVCHYDCIILLFWVVGLMLR